MADDIKQNPDYWVFRNHSRYWVRRGSKIVPNNPRVADVAAFIKSNKKSVDPETVKINRLPSSGQRALNYLLGLPKNTLLLKQDEVEAMIDLIPQLADNGLKDFSVYDVYGWLINYGSNNKH